MTAVKTSRKDRARATRTRILGSARDLFTAHGYQATTMADVAEHAGVAVQTVYFVFHTKTELLEDVYTAAVLGEDQVRPPDTDWYRTATTSTNPDEVIAALVAGMLPIARRVGPLQAILDTIADDDVRALRAEKEALRRNVAHTLLTHLADLDALRADLTARTGTDLLLGLTSPGLYQQMTAEHGWTHNQWATTLTRQLRHALLPPDTPTT